MYGLMTNGWICLPVGQPPSTGARVKPARVQVVAEPTTIVKVQVKSNQGSGGSTCTGP